MRLSLSLLSLSAFIATVLRAETTRPVSAEFAGAAQPQLAASEDGRVWVAFGRGKDICVAASSDGGATFAEPVRVATLPSLMVGRRRGPRIVAHGDQLTVTAIAGELFAFHSKDGGKTWMGPALINDVRRSAREGLDGLAVAPDGRLFAVWLDLRALESGGRTQLFASESTDGGATWSANTLVYRAPAGSTVCECCHPSALFNRRGDLAVMWRNGIEGARDMWIATRPAGATAFGPATKLGKGTWMLKGCPMDGGVLFTQSEDFASVWQREGAVFLARPGSDEVKLSAGTQPVAATGARGAIALWQQGADLWSSALGAKPAPKIFAANAHFPSVIAVPGKGRVLVAYERGSDTMITSVEPDSQ